MNRIAPTQHPDESAFLSAILADPHDDTVRLVYADWLDENGQADRAAMVRIENPPHLGERSKDASRWQNLALAQLAPVVPPAWRPWVIDGPTSPRWLCRYVEPGEAPTSWTKHIGSHIGGDRPVMCCIRHGFVSGVGLSEKGFLKYARGIVAANPISWVGITNKRPMLLGIQGGLFVWVRNDAGRRPAAWALPPELFSLVLAQVEPEALLHHGSLRQDCVSFPDRAAAYLALETALVKYSRPKDAQGIRINK